MISISTAFTRSNSRAVARGRLQRRQSSRRHPPPPEARPSSSPRPPTRAVASTVGVSALDRRASRVSLARRSSRRSNPIALVSHLPAVSPSSARRARASDVARARTTPSSSRASSSSSRASSSSSSAAARRRRRGHAGARFPSSRTHRARTRTRVRTTARKSRRGDGARVRRRRRVDLARPRAGAIRRRRAGAT